MQVLEGSVIYRLLKKLLWCYQHSKLKRFISAFTVCCQNCFIARCFRSAGKFRGFSGNSLVIRGAGRLFNRLYKCIDRLVLRLSDLLQKWSEGSILCYLFRFFARASEERLSVLALPVFGIGYIFGRLILNRLMIRDILFLSVTFFAAAVLLIDRNKLNAFFRNSLFYKLYLLVLG